MTGQDNTDYNKLFLQTAKEHVESLETQLAVLNSSPTPKDIIDEIYRRAHSLKGSSSFMQHSELSQTCNKITALVLPLKESLSVEKELIQKLSALVQDLKKQINQIEDTNNNL